MYAGSNTLSGIHPLLWFEKLSGFSIRTCRTYMGCFDSIAQLNERVKRFSATYATKVAISEIIKGLG